MRRSLIYVRQSDSGGEGEESLSLESQEAALRKRAETDGLVVVGVERDADRRGWQTEAARPGFRGVMERARRREYDVLLIWDGSRFARDVVLQEQSVRELAGLGVEVVSLTEAWFGDPMVRQILAAVNERRTREIRDHIRRSVRALVVEHGVKVGREPYAYRRPNPRQPLVLGPEEEQAEVRYLMERYADGASPAAIAWQLNLGLAGHRPGRRWNDQAVRAILRNPTYRGHVVAGDAVRQDAHPVFLGRDLLDRVDRQLRERSGGRRAPRRKPRDHWLEGLVAHECGASAYLMYMGAGSLTFRCRDTWNGTCLTLPGQRAAIWVEREARSLLVRLFELLPERGVVVERTDRSLGDRGRRTADRRQELLAKREALRRRLERVAQMALDQDLSDLWYDAQRRQVTEEREAVERDLAALAEAVDPEAVVRATEAIRALSNAEVLARVEDGAVLSPLLRELGWVEFGPSGTALRLREPYASVFGFDRLDHVEQDGDPRYPNPRIADEVRWAIWADRASGLSVRQIARRHGVSWNTARRWVRESPAAARRAPFRPSRPGRE